MLPIRRRLYQSQPGFSPRQIFSALQGAWLEPSPGYIWQENTGVTPTTTGGQTIGLMLDQSQGAVLGPELVTNNGGPFTSLTGWVQDDCTAEIVDGKLRFTTTGDYGRVVHPVPMQAGKTYLCSVSITYISGNISNAVAITSSSQGSGAITNITGLGSRSVAFYHTESSTTTRYISVGNNFTIPGVVMEFPSISVRQILGNHASQSTAANRPTYQLDSNNLPLARFDANDVLTVSLPNLGGGIFSSAGSVYFATPVGMSQLNNQSMGTSYTLPALSTDIYSWIVVPQRLNAAQESRLERYMLRLANLPEPDYLLDSSDNQLTADDGELLLRA